MNETYSAGRALSLGFRLFFRNLIPFAILAAIVSLPFAAWAYFKFQNLESTFTDQYFQFKYIAMQGLTGVVIAAPLTYGVVMDLNGKRASLIDCIGMGIKRLFPVLGVGILLGLMLILIGFGLVLIAVAFQSAIIAVILIYGVLAMVYAIYYVAVPAAVIERPGVAGALLRSRDLTSGHRGAIIGVMVIFLVVRYFVGQWIQDSMLESVMSNPDPENAIDTVRKWLCIEIAITTVIAMITGVISAVTYYLLRSEKEGTSSQDLASVFE